MKLNWLLFILIIASALASAPVLANGDDVHLDDSGDVHSDDPENMDIQWDDPVTYIILTSILLVLISIVAVVAKKFTEKNKKSLFWIIVITVMLTTLYLGGHTIYENVTSVTKGPVHWHADYQVWACGERLELVDPTGLSGEIGSTTLHEHDDDRIHVEGTVMDYDDISLEKYFFVIGAELTLESILFPTEEQGVISYANGDDCPDGRPGELKIYVNGAHLDDMHDYLYFPATLVPPGDCIIIEFGAGLAETTERICESWEVQEWNYENYETLRDV